MGHILNKQSSLQEKIETINWKRLYPRTMFTSEFLGRVSKVTCLWVHHTSVVHQTGRAEVYEKEISKRLFNTKQKWYSPQSAEKSRNTSLCKK